MEEEKNCENCRYYYPHYVISTSRLYQVQGHCANEVFRKHNVKDKRKYCEKNGCWEPAQNKKAERRKAIKEVLRDIDKSLFDIKLILKNDED